MADWPLAFGAKTRADEVLAGIDLSGRVALVTGANTGIGYETARALAAAGAQVYMGCRDATRGAAAVQRCLATHPDAKAQLALLDLSSLGAVRAFADSFPADKLDILVCNAGVYGGGFAQTEDGFERCVGVCHIGHFLLFQLLAERIAAGSGGRVVMVSSESHRTPKHLSFEKLPLTGGAYSDLVAYGQAKLCNVLMARGIEARHGAAGIHAFSLHPGTLVTTEIGRASALAKALVFLSRPFTKTPNQGAATSVMCAAHPALDAFAGAYFSNCRPRRASKEASDREVADRLWALSEQWVAPFVDGTA